MKRLKKLVSGGIQNKIFNLILAVVDFGGTSFDVYIENLMSTAFSVIIVK